MSPLSTKSALAVSLSILSLLVSSTDATFAVRDAEIHPRDDTPVGCYSSSDGLTNQGPWTYQSVGYCKPICQKKGNAVFAMTNADECWCGDSLPPGKTDDSSCNLGCQGFPANLCGGNGFWSVYLTGTKSLDQLGGGSSSSSTSSSSATTNLVTTSVAPGQTIIVTAPAPAASPSASSKNDGNGDGSGGGGHSGGGGGSNTAGIAAGVVVGVVAAGALVGGIFFFIRRRKQQQADEEYRKQHQVSDFVNGSKEGKPPSSGYSQMSDQRLDPVMNRRNSVGSLADEQDYSRRILRVANPDR